MGTVKKYDKWLKPLGTSYDHADHCPHWELVSILICKFFIVIVSGFQWFSVLLSGFWDAIGIKGAIEIMLLPGSLCIQILHCLLQIKYSPLILGTTGNM